MWDFDGVPLKEVENALSLVQHKYALPDIYIFNGGKQDSYMAYCYERLPWRKALSIVLDTPHVDYNFIKYSAFREKFTLRVSPKCGRWVHAVKILKSRYPETATVRDLQDWVIYETLTKPSKKHIIRIGGSDDAERRRSTA
jgi:PhoPQ-activated pathogenicity-related protein